jgi:broad specificity phosphatase PhoE
MPVPDFSLAHGASEILLVRHADAVPDEGTHNDGHSYRDLPLSTRGRAQARALAQRLSAGAVGAIYASPLLRARETAQAVAEATGCDVSYDERLREVEIGGLNEPRHPAEFGAHLDRLAEMAIRHGGWSQIPGTEGSGAIRTRMREAIDAVVEANAGKRIVVVSHAGAINAYLAGVLDMRSDFFFPAANTSISTLRARGGRRLLLALNDIAHLQEQRVP